MGKELGLELGLRLGLGLGLGVAKTRHGNSPPGSVHIDSAAAVAINALHAGVVRGRDVGNVTRSGVHHARAPFTL